MSSLMLQYSIMKHIEKTNYEENHDMQKLNHIYYEEIYENYIANSYPLILTMPEMDQYQKETSNP